MCIILISYNNNNCFAAGEKRGDSYEKPAFRLAAPNKGILPTACSKCANVTVWVLRVQVSNYFHRLEWQRRSYTCAVQRERTRADHTVSPSCDDTVY